MTQPSLLWKFVLIAVVIGASVYFSYPPEEKVDLGLDLQGGLHIVLRVDTSSAVKNEMDNRVTYMGNAFTERGLAYASLVPDVAAGSIILRGTDPMQEQQVRELIEDFIGQWDISETGAGSWRFKIPPRYREEIERGAVTGSLETLRNRVDALGVSEPVITEQGRDGDEILIQLPGVQDPERVKRLLKDPAKLEWKQMTYPPGTGQYQPLPSQEAVLALFGGVLPDDTDLFPEPQDGQDGTEFNLWWPLKRVSTVQGSDLRNAYRTTNEWQDSVVAFDLNPDAAGRFEAATRANIEKVMAILLDGKVISAPTIKNVIRNSGTIYGGFTIETADDLALKLRTGAIPADISIEEEWTVGPSLGRDSIRSGAKAMIAGFIGVMLFMLVYYRLSGINAVIALVLNVLLVFGVLAALPFLFKGARATLTLPGIAGLILTVGMAVDSNVLIFERIREELDLGKTLRSAVEQGFGKAFSTILDCNVTTLVAAFFLFSYGTGPVKGFAVTLTIGLLASMFTAIFVSRQLFELVLRARSDAESLSI
jgi:preprotein translocase subunit SecD